MTEHLTLDARESMGGEINPPQSLESELKTVASIHLGTVGLMGSLDTSGPTKSLNVFDDTVRTGGTETMTNNQEGIQNAELFKRTYDAAVESIDDALQIQGSTDELNGKIPTLLSNIDALRAVPYISSAPEFVAMVEAARSSVEANNLSQAKQQLAGTLIAYSPQR